MKRRKKLTPTEDRALGDLVRLVAKYINPRVRKNAVPERVTILPGAQAMMMLNVNDLLVRAFDLLSVKSDDSKRQPLFKREAAIFMMNALNALSTDIRNKLMGEKPISSLILTGQEAGLYFNILSYAHDRWAMIRGNYIETSKDMAAAAKHATRVLWIVRSLINVGHPPVEASRFMK
jgi:hypothetical protein